MRIEINVMTNARKEIDQIAFKRTDDEEDILVLDVGVTPPDGYYEFDPASVDG